MAAKTIGTGRGLLGPRGILAAGALAMSLLPLAASALEVHSIQVGSFASAEEAEKARADAAESCSPAFIQEDDSTGMKTFKVLVGQFPYYAEAWVCMKNLRGQGLYPGCSVATWEWDGRDLEASRLPVALPFDTAGLADAAASAAGVAPDPEAHWKAAGLAGLPEPDAALLAKSADAMTPAELAEVAFAASDKAVALPALRRFVASNPSAPEINRARLRLARLTGRDNPTEAASALAAVRAAGANDEKALCDLIDAYILSAQKKRAESIAAFRSLANNAALAPSLRLEAMQRVARHAHALKHYPTAWLAFEQIEKTTPDPAEAAQARMQRAGLAFELVGCAKGTWEETKTLCLSAAAMPGATRQTQATAKLMYIEALYHQNKVTDALEEVTRYLETYSDVPREYFVGLTWQGVFLCDLQQYDEAQAIFTQVLAEKIPDGEKFARTEPQALAAHWLAWLAHRRGDLAEMKLQLNFLAATFPENPLGKDALRQLKALEGKAQ